MSTDGSITRCMRNLAGGQHREEAARELWERFFGDLARHALRKLRSMRSARGSADEEDAAERAFTKVFRGIETGQLQLANRNELRRLLLVATAREAISQNHRDRRGSSAGDGAAIHEVPAAELAPDLLALAQESCRRLLDALGDMLLRRIALWKLIGHTNEEIARELGCSLAKVERKIVLIRERWAELAPGQLSVKPGPRGSSRSEPMAVEQVGTTCILRRLGGQP